MARFVYNRHLYDLFFFLAFRALLQIQALQPLDPDELIDDDEMTGNPKVRECVCVCVCVLSLIHI